MMAMAGLILLSFAMVNLQSLLWQASDWLVGAVLPAVIVDLTNEERGIESKTYLKRNAMLDEAARLKAEHMAENQYFSHFSPDGTSPWYWFGEVSYQFAHAGENLAIHFSDSGAVVKAWMNSPLHRANIVNDNFTEIGVGTAKGKYEGYDTVYVVQLFGTPAMSPVEILSTESESIDDSLAEVSGQNNERIVADTFGVGILGVEYQENEEDLGSKMKNGEKEILPVAENTDLASSMAKTETSMSDKTSDSSDQMEGYELSLMNESEAEEGVLEADILEQSEVFSSYMATSSGLMAIDHADTVATGGTTVSGIESLTVRPNALLQVVYLLVGSFVVTLLLLSIIISIRNHRPMQVVYGIGLLILMSGLFYIHISLTEGAVIASEVLVEERV